jgi:hypothetical protein
MHSRDFFFRGVPALCWIVAVAGLTGCASIPVLDRAVLHVGVSRPVVIVSSDESLGWGKIAFPWLSPLGSNRVVLSYSTMGDAYEQYLDTPAVSDWPVFSDDGGASWRFEDPFFWADGPMPFRTSVSKGEVYGKFNYGFYFGVVSSDNGFTMGQLRMVSKRGNSPSDGSLWGLRVSTSDGRNWHGPGPVEYVGPTNIGLMFLSTRAVALEDGSILVAAWASPVDFANSGYSTLIFRSVDGGRKFEYLSTAGTPQDAWWGNEGPCEPCLVRLQNGEILCMMRTGAPSSTSAGTSADAFLLARSSDGGRTWRHERMPFIGVMPQLRQMSNGVLVCAFGRPGINLIFSLDNGKTWIREIPLISSTAKTSGYVDAVEVSPGRLLVVYDAYDTDLAGIWLWEPKEVNGIFGRFVNVRVLFGRGSMNK